MKIADIYRDEPSLTKAEWIQFLDENSYEITCKSPIHGFARVNSEKANFVWKRFSSLSDDGIVVVSGSRQLGLSISQIIARDLRAEVIAVSETLPKFDAMVTEFEDRFVWITAVFDGKKKRILARLGQTSDKWGGRLYFTRYCPDTHVGDEGWSMIPCDQIENIEVAEP